MIINTVLYIWDLLLDIKGDTYFWNDRI